MKPGDTVVITMKWEVLHNATAKLIRRNATGTATLTMLEERGTYKIGDEVCVGPGEFQKESI